MPVGNACLHAAMADWCMYLGRKNPWLIPGRARAVAHASQFAHAKPYTLWSASKYDRDI
jgi:hypothetical protein